MQTDRAVFPVYIAQPASPFNPQTPLAIKRSYSDEEKATALAALDANGKNVLQTSRQLSIPHKTLENWSNERGVTPAVAEMGNIKKGELKDELEKLAYKLVANLSTSAELASFKEAAIALGIVVDKMQLLAGKPTAITDDATLSNADRVERIRTILNSRTDSGSSNQTTD